jgi:hypothetical protein
MLGVPANLLHGCGRFMWQNVLSFPGTWRVECPHTSVNAGGSHCLLVVLLRAEATFTRERRRLLIAAVTAWHLDVDEPAVTTASAVALQAPTAEHVRSAEARHRCRRREDHCLAEKPKLFVRDHLTR